MSHNQAINRVIEACQSLNSQNKAPSIALVKTRLSTPLPLAVIVRGIQQFKNNPNIEIKNVALETATSTADNKTDQQRIQQLESQVSNLTNEVKALQVLVADLMSGKS